MLIHRDADLLVIDKPAGLAVHAGTRTTRHLDGLLAALAEAPERRPLLVHRLDKDTSGLIVAALDRGVAATLGKAFAGRRVTKEYRAVVVGVPEGGEGRVDLPLVKRRTAAGDRVLAAPRDPEADAASTLWRLVEAAADGSRALLALFPETGRQHQLRVHMAAIGHPILGDRLYAPPSVDAGAPRLHLHAHRLAFRHPRGDEARFEAPVPAVFATALARPGVSAPPGR